MVVTTARVRMKAARATVAGATRTTATTVTMAATAAMAATMTPNSGKFYKDGICRRQQCRDIIHRSKSAGKRDRQLISQGGHVLLNSARRGSPPPCSWRAGKHGQQQISRGGRRLNSRGRSRPRSWWRLCWGAGCLAHHAHVSPFVGVGAGLTGPVGIGKDGWRGEWLVWGWRGGVADYQGTKKEKGEGENLACGWG